MAAPKILCFDLEVLPDLQKALKYWTKLSSFPGKTLRASVTSICCIGWKWFGEDRVHCINAWDFPEWKKNVNDDRRVLEAFLEIIEEADAIVTHNGKRFDKKYLMTKLLLSGLDLPDESPHIDTKAISSANFFFIDNKLQTLGEELFGERKLDHEGWDMWVSVHGRDPKAMKTMTAYCKQDVLLLEKIYRKFRPKARGIPNHNIFPQDGLERRDVCPKCGSTRLKSNGYRYTKTSAYQRLICVDCRSWCRADATGRNPR